MTVESLYRIANHSLYIDVVFYYTIRGQTIHIVKFWSEEAGCFVERKMKKDRFISKYNSYQYFHNYKDAWKELTFRLKEKIKEGRNIEKYQARLDHHMTQI